MTKTTEKLKEKKTRTKQSLAQREDLAGKTYRTVRDNPGKSAAVAAVTAAAAGAGAFFFAKSRKTPETVQEEVAEINKEGVKAAKRKSPSKKREPLKG